VRVKITMRVKITLCLQKSLSCVSLLHLLVSKSHSYVSQSHCACRNHSCACWNHSRECRIHIRACQNHKACRNHNACINCACCYHSRECHIHTHKCQTYSRVCRKQTMRVKSHSACGNQSCACWNYTLRLEITLCVYKSHSSVSKLHS
jgi:hypothetical protein